MAAEFTGEAPVEAEGDEARSPLALITAQNLLHRRFQVVVAENPEDALTTLERMLMCFQESLLGGAAIRAVEGVCNAEELSHFTAVKMSHSGLVPCSLFPEILNV